MIDRRKFLRAALFVAAAPMIVKASSLMKVRALPVEIETDWRIVWDNARDGLVEWHSEMPQKEWFAIASYPEWRTVT